MAAATAWKTKARVALPSGNLCSVTFKAPVEETAPGFIADVHLGKVAKALRLTAFDTLYNDAFAGATLIGLSTAGDRVLQPRSAAMLQAFR